MGANEENKKYFLTIDDKLYSIQKNMSNQGMTRSACFGCAFDFRQKNCIEAKRECYAKYQTCCAQLHSIFKKETRTKKRKLNL
tara:strand:- start:673 stop:921 length:249 start_codon:yes stop_codon:yes gene_type:complete